MEINQFEQIVGVKTQADIVEGRFVILTTQGTNGLFMNVDSDLPGVRVPATAEEAKRAKFCVTFAPDNRPTPIVDYPQTSYDFRGGFVNSTAGPLTGVKMWLTHPGNQESQTIPSGYKALAITEATVTLPSGQYIYNAGLTVPGACVIVGDTTSDTTDAGKPKYTASMAAGVIGFVQHYDSTTGALTIRIE
jgi:hypothetical protein